MKSERDAYGHQTVTMAMQLINSGNQEPMLATTNAWKTKIPDPPMLTDGKEPRFEDWLPLMTQKLTANADQFNTQLCMA